MNAHQPTRWDRFRAWLESVPLRRRKLAGVLVCYAAFLLAMDADLWRPHDYVKPDRNVNVAEAAAWLSGQVNLMVPEGSNRRPWDSALYEGKVYSHFPPAFTFASLAVLPWSPVGIPHWFVVGLLVMPLPGLAYLLFLRRCGKVTPAVIITLCYLIGTSLIPLMGRAVRSSPMWHVNHALSQLGLLIVLLELFGRRRLWVAGVGMAVAFWSRQLTLAYLIPVAWMVLAKPVEAYPRWRQVLSLACLGAVLVSMPLILNAIKFGNPLDSGYAHVYAGRDDKLSREGEHGIFSLHFVPRNLYYMNLGFPRFVHVAGSWHWRHNFEETGIWWTTPVLMYLLMFWQKIWKSPDGRPLLVAVALIFTTLLFYHSTGWEQRGYNRYSLDYVPAMLALVAPYCWIGHWRWVTALSVEWSVLYFNRIL